MKNDLAIQGEELKALMKDYQSQCRRAVKAVKRKSKFKVEWVRLPSRWIDRLRTANMGGATYQLAHTILVESFKLDQMAVKEIVLSAEVTGLSRMVRKRATDNLVKLKLIRVRRKVGSATRVIDLYL